MGLTVDKKALLAAIDTSSRTIDQRDEQLRRTKKACAALSSETRLTGHGWQAAKEQAATLNLHIEQTLEYNRAVLNDHRTLASLLNEYIDDDFISEDAINQAQEHLRRIDNTIATAQSKLPHAVRTLTDPVINDLLDHNRHTQTWLQGKIKRLHQFDQATANLYGGSNKLGDSGGLHKHQWWEFWEKEKPDDPDMENETNKITPPPGLLKTDPLNADELTQGQISDCWLISTLAALMDSGYTSKKVSKTTVTKSPPITSSPSMTAANHIQLKSRKYTKTVSQAMGNPALHRCTRRPSENTVDRAPSIGAYRPQHGRPSLARNNLRWTATPPPKHSNPEDQLTAPSPSLGPSSHSREETQTDTN